MTYIFIICLNKINFSQNNHDTKHQRCHEKLQFELLQIYQLWNDDFEHVTDMEDMQYFESLLLEDIIHYHGKIKTLIIITNSQIEVHEVEINKEQKIINGNCRGVLRKRDRILEKGRIEGEYVKACKSLIMAEYENKKLKHNITKRRQIITQLQNENKIIERIQKYFQEKIEDVRKKIVDKKNDIENQTFSEKLQHQFLKLYRNWQDDYEDVTDVYDLQDFESNLLESKEQSQSKIEKQLEINNKEIEEKLKIIKLSQIKAKKEKSNNIRNGVDELVQDIEQLEIENEEIKKLQRELQQKVEEFQQQIADKKQQLHQGLTPARIQKFSLYLPDESSVGDQCGICLKNIEINTKMMRLDCKGQHSFCQYCTEKWFADNNTCPICRHKFN